MKPIPLGERRSSGMSAPQTTYPSDSHLLVHVTVAAVKDGCVLGLVLEHLDETGASIAAENVSTYGAPRTHKRITTVKGCMVRMIWILTGDKPSSTFEVITAGISSVPIAVTENGTGEDLDFSKSIDVDLTSFRGLKDYLYFMAQEPKEGITQGAIPRA